MHKPTASVDVLILVILNVHSRVLQ